MMFWCADTCFFCDAHPSLSFATLRVGNTCSTGPSPTITIWPWCTNPPYFHPGRVRNGGGGGSGCGGFGVVLTCGCCCCCCSWWCCCCSWWCFCCSCCSCLVIAAAAQWVAINCNHRWSSIWNGRPINSSNEGTNGVAVVVALFFYTLVVDVALLYAFPPVPPVPPVYDDGPLTTHQPPLFPPLVYAVPTAW